MNGSNYSTVNAGDVGFSQGARVLVGAVGAGKGGCRPIGLLAADATLSMDKTYRTKMDHFPEVEVVSAVQALTMEGKIVVREWNKANLMLALDVAASMVTDVAASPVNVVDEPYKMPASGQLSVTIPRTGLTNIVVKEAPSTTLAINDDYVVVVTPTTTMIVAVSGGGIAASDDLLISYDYTPLVHTEMPLGHSAPRQYYEVWFEEGRTTSATARTDYQIYRAAIGLDGNFNINSAENGVDLPLIIQASLAPGQTSLGKLYDYQ